MGGEVISVGPVSFVVLGGRAERRRWTSPGGLPRRIAVRRAVRSLDAAVSAEAFRQVEDAHARSCCSSRISRISSAE